MYEMAHASLNPARAVTDATKILFQNPLNPWTHTEFGKSVAAGCELFERTTRRYGKPDWNLPTTEVNGVRTAVEVRSVWEKPFCRLLHFDRKLTRPLRSPQPRVLIVAPMSGHYATLLRGTVEAFLPTHEVYITDWADARMVPLAARPVRSRRLRRLPDRDAARARRQHPYRRGVPARRCRWLRPFR